MAIDGTVRIWHDGEGWGVIDSDETPGGCWTHFSAVAVAGFRSLSAGQAVELEYEEFEQDGYPYRAVRVWPTGQDPAPDPEPGPPGSAYRSSLTITFEPDDGSGSGQPGPGDRNPGGQ